MSIKEIKTWPINIDPTCQAKWNWSTIYLTNSASASCHRTTQYKFDLDTFDDFHNLPEKLRDRQMMLDGTWPGNGCEYCKKIEDAGGASDRIMTSFQKNVTPIEVLADPTAVSVVPTMVEVYFDNTCDLKCIYCGPWYSSAWDAENKKHGDWKYDSQYLSADYTKSSNRRQYVDKFFDWWDRHYESLTHFQFLGGEPFYQSEFDEFVDFIKERSNPKLTIVFSSNLNCSLTRLKSKISVFKELIEQNKLGCLQIVGSIDCWGIEQEYIRYPLRLSQWEQNFEYLVSEEWIRLSINSAINSLSIKTMPELLRKLSVWRQTRPIYQNFMSVQDPHPTNPDYIGSGVFDEDFTQIIDVMKQDIHLDLHYEKYILYMDGINNQIKASQPNLKKLSELYHYLTELDRRRNTNWQTIFPWLVVQFDRFDIK